jgi:DNA-binding SARP family transcriptional activator
MDVVDVPDNNPGIDEAIPPVLLCLFGSLRLLRLGQSLAIRRGGRTEELLSILALGRDQGLRRETLLDRIWPNTAPALACQSLNSLVHSICMLLRDALAGKPPILYESGCYRLNLEAGVGVDVMLFDALVQAGDQGAARGDCEAAMAAYCGAVDLYGGDLCPSTDVLAVIERERLRASFLSALAYLACRSVEDLDYVAALSYAFRLLANDPCREDAHRLVMRCHMQRGERAQALRQYQLCCKILQAEFNATPEPATTQLFDQLLMNQSV